MHVIQYKNGFKPGILKQLVHVRTKSIVILYAY